MKHTRILIGMGMLILLATAVQGLGIGTLEKSFVYTADQTSSIDFHIVKEAGQKWTLELGYEGALEPYMEFRIPHYWYSGKGDKLNVNVEREFDLTNVSIATLQFYTKYDIEYGWDFGYVEISTNNGSTWTQLPTAHTTTYYDPSLGSYPYKAAYLTLGAPAFTGQVSSWTLEEANLTPYTGNMTKIRFRYATDNVGWSLHGWLIDDIAIPEIGFTDDMENGNNGWTTNGWMRNTIEDTDSAVVTITLDFNIPSSFTYNGTTEKVTVKKLAATDSGWNPTYGATSEVEAFMPQISKYVAPPPSSGGGGGGGGGGGSTSNYIVYRNGAAIYYANRLMDGETISIGRRIETPIKEIQIGLKNSIRNAQVHIIPYTSVPSHIKSFFETVYDYVEIATNVEDEDITEVHIAFFVPRGWMQDNDAITSDIVVMRYHNGRWEELETNFIGMEGSNYIFDAITPGFSTYAIIKRGQEPQVPETEPEPTEPATPPPEDLVFVGNETDREAIEELVEAKMEPEYIQNETQEMQTGEVSGELGEQEPKGIIQKIGEKIKQAIGMKTKGQEKTTTESIELGSTQEKTEQGTLIASILLISITFLIALTTLIIIYARRKK